MNLIKHFTLAGTAAAVALASSFALAQVPPAPGATPANAAASQAGADQQKAGRKGGARKGGERGERFKKADTNNDGSLSKAEVDAAGMKRLSANFDKIDANKDGKITRDEMKAARTAHKGERKHKRNQPAAPVAPAPAPAAPATK